MSNDQTETTIEGTTVIDLRRDNAEEPGAVLWGVVPMFGMAMHIAFVEVHDVDDVQTAVDDPYDIFSGIGWFTDSRLETVRIPGFPGEYVAVVYPMGS